MIRKISLTVFLFSMPLAVMAEPAQLLGLEYLNFRERTKLSTTVSAEAGVFLSEHRGKPSDRVAIVPGSALEQKQRPANRVVKLYRGAGKERVLVCAINIRYYRVAEQRWMPEYQLHQEPVIVRENNRWKPVGTISGEAGGVVITSNTLPSAEGYYRWLEFTVGIGVTYIDSWETT